VQQFGHLFPHRACFYKASAPLFEAKRFYILWAAHVKKILEACMFVCQVIESFPGRRPPGKDDHARLWQNEDGACRLHWHSMGTVAKGISQVVVGA
jgi:hypothetical protein